MAFDKLKNLFNVDIKDGLKGSAVVQSSSMPTPQAQMYNVTMWLDVHVEGREPYRVHYECMVKAGKHPWPGTTLPVIVDRENPERIDVQWKDIQTIDERMAAEGPGPVAELADGVIVGSRVVRAAGEGGAAAVGAVVGGARGARSVPLGACRWRGALPGRDGRARTEAAARSAPAARPRRSPAHRASRRARRSRSMRGATSRPSTARDAEAMASTGATTASRTSSRSACCAGRDEIRRFFTRDVRRDARRSR